VATERSQNWALVLGASSGFGAAAALELARSGFGIVGVHLDRRATLPAAAAVQSAIRETGREAMFFNGNAADPARRAAVVGACRGLPGIRVLFHSLAFGTLKPFIATEAAEAVRPADMDMTLDVMAHSLVYWVQDLIAAGCLKPGAKVFAMTSAGGHRAWPAYGAVSAAKAALEAHVRQLAVELGPHGISVNALQAGVTETPAARRIPKSADLFARALENNPGGRLTTPEDVARFLAAWSLCPSNWAAGNVVRIDGGEDLV